MKTLFTSLLVLVSLLSSSQNNWLRSAGGSNHDEALDMAPTSDNNFAVVGYFTSATTFGTTALTSSGFSDAFVQKIDVDGATIWVKKLGGIKPDRATSVACDNSGNIYVTGFYSNQATFGSVTLNQVADSLEIFITKLNSAGDVLWAKACGGISDDYSYAITTDNAGNVIVTGKFRGEAQFGATTLQSEMYDDNSYWSYDIFITKLDTDGNWLWAKKGSANDDDRGLSVCTDNNDNIYVTGQFSNDITFDILHTNNVANAGFLVKYSPNGSELWFNKFAASQLITYDLAEDNEHNILVTGEFSGQMAIFNSGINFIPASYPYNIFLTKFNQGGNLLWGSSAGSQNFCSAKALAIGANNEAYVTGTFNCKMTEFSAEYGEGIFNSVGFRDIFITRFNSDGARTWERHFASATDDFCSAIAYSGMADKPIIAGSYDGYFNVPANDEFVLNTENYVDSWNYSFPNCNTNTFCSDDSYASFIQAKSNGNKDIFFSSPVNLNRQPYDFYNRLLPSSPICDKPVVAPCISDLYSYGCDFSSVCADSIVLCSQSFIYLNTNTGSEGFIGPGYSLNWAGLGNLNQLYISNTGTYSITISRDDGCWSFNDEAFVTVVPPACPLINDNAGYNNVPTCNPTSIIVCSPQIVTLAASGFTETNGYWSDFTSGSVVYNDSLTVANSGTFIYQFTDDYNCYHSSIVNVQVNYELDTIVPYLMVGSNAIDSSVVTLCANEMQCINISLMDSLLSPPDLFATNVEVDWVIYFNNQVVYQINDGSVNICLPVTNSGWYQIIATPTIQHPWPCVGTIPYPSVALTFFIDIISPPNLSLSIAGDTFICPGDTTLIVGTGADSLWFSSIFPFTPLSSDSILINEFGWYTLNGTNTLGGCVASNTLAFQIQSKPDPLAWTVPASGIVCPNETVQLWCEPGLSYHWIGPLGNLLDDTQSIDVGTPGFYYCILTDSVGCVLESNTIEVKEYSTPYLIPYPGTDLCVNGEVLIQLATNDYQSIWWGDPFYNDYIEQLITQPGTYTVSVAACGITTELEINITDSDTPSIITPSSTILCPNDSITLSANNGMLSYLWQPQFASTQVIQITEPGDYSLITTDELGCIGTSTIHIDMYDIASPQATGTILCAGQIAELNATSSNSVYWTTDSEGLNIVANTANYTTPVISNTTVYYVFAQDATCSSYATEVIVEVYPSSLPPIIGGNYSVCLGADAILTAPMLQGVNYTWTLPNGALVQSDTLYINNSTELDEGVYYLTANDSNCSGAQNNILFEVVPPEELQLTSENYLSVCVGNSLQLLSPIVATNYAWQTPQGNFNGGPTLVINSASQADAGTYLLTVTGAVCAFTILPTLVEVVEYPDVQIDPAIAHCDGGYMTIGFMQEYDNYLWSTGETDPYIHPADTGWYSVEVSNGPGCSAFVHAHVTSLDCIDGFINVITCNGDGLNDFADFGVLRAQINAVHIYNRWGTSITTLTPTRLKWDGTHINGEKVNSGVYYYVIEYNPNQPKNCDCYLPVQGYLQVFAKE